MKVRNGTVADAKQVIALFTTLDLKHIENQNDFKKSPNVERYNQLIQKCLNEQDYCLSVVEMRGEVVGFAIGRMLHVVNHPYLADKKIGEILYMAIDEQYKQNGYGRNILEDLEKRLEILGAERFEIRVYDFNKEACPEKADYKKKFTVYEKIVDQKQA